MTPVADLPPVSATAYCLRGAMADGTSTRRRSAASNRHPLGTRLRVVGRQAGPNGMRLFVVRDRIGWGSELDLWHESCSLALAFGRHRLRYKLGWAKP